MRTATITGAIPRALALVASLSLAACAMGGADMPDSIQGKELHFTEMDQNLDNRLDPNEIDEHLVLYRDFAQWDYDDNGVITRNEFDNYLEAMEELVFEDDEGL